jgi:hypothetical protein
MSSSEIPKHFASQPAGLGSRQSSMLSAMKATIDLPDDLCRRVKAKSARQGRPVRAVALELFQCWLAEDSPSAQSSPEQRAVVAGDPTMERTAEEWPERWFRLADEISKDAPPGPTAREILERDRNRLERP